MSGALLGVMSLLTTCAAAYIVGHLMRVVLDTAS